MQKNDDPTIIGEPVSQIVENASQIVKATKDMIGNKAPDRQGGYLVIQERSSGKILLLERIGKCPTSDIEKYLNFAQEKGLRLINNENISSWQTRDPENDKWGGAIMAHHNSLIISFSGLEEIIDEAVALTLALRQNWLSYNEFIAIAKISENYFAGMLYGLSLLGQKK